MPNPRGADKQNGGEVKMKLWNLMPLFMLLLLAGMAAAGCDYNALVEPITFTKIEYVNACIEYEWTHTQGSRPDFNNYDFNNYIVKATGDFSLGDTNHAGKSYSLCTVEPGSTVTFYVQAYESDDFGYYCGFDYNATLKTGGYIGAGKLMVYTLLIVFGGFIAVIIFVMVAIWGIKKMKIPIPFMKK